MELASNTDVANLPLPKGMTLSDLYNRVPLAIAATSAAAVLFWDHLVLMPHELKANYSTEAPHWRLWDLPVFILLRYSGIACMIAFLFLHVVGTDNCQAIWIIVQATYVVTVAASCYLLALRVSTIAGNVAMLIVQLFPHEYDYVKASAAPFSVLVSVATASRVALNTRSLRQFRSNFELKGSHRQTASKPSFGQHSSRNPTFDSSGHVSSLTSSPTIAPRKISDPFPFSQPLSKTSLSSLRSRTPSPLPLAQLGVDMPLSKSIEIEQKDALPDSPAAISPRTPDTAQSSNKATIGHARTPTHTSQIVLSPSSPSSNPPLTAYTPITPSIRTPLTAQTPSSSMSELEFAPTSVIVGNKHPKLGHGGAATIRHPSRTSSLASASLQLPSAGQRLLAAESKFATGRAKPASPTKPLPKNQYTTFPSPQSSVSSLTFTPPSGRSIPPTFNSPFGNLA
ncbi:hypothetical protein DL96DRAFT_1702564 [Flagelloscypha sp. PMI_526]|nr:hypothetical protein DL96DRAFT_1702564 [Flagelloscypha sp. PMI_526]